MTNGAKMSGRNITTSTHGQPRIYVIVGSEEGLVREEARKIFQTLSGGNDDGFTHEIIPGAAANAEEAERICNHVVEALLTAPLFGSDKVVWLRNATFLRDDVTSRAQLTEAGIERLRAVLAKGLPPQVRFLLSANGIDKRRALWKLFEAEASLHIFEAIKPGEDGWHEQAAVFASERAQQMGLCFDDEATIALLTMLTGPQAQAIINALVKLDLYLGAERRVVASSDIRALVPATRETGILEVGLAIQRGETAAAIARIDELLLSGESPVAIMRASILNTLRNLYFAKLIEQRCRPSLKSYASYVAALKKLSPRESAWLPRKKDGSGLNLYPIFVAAPAAQRFELQGLQRTLEAAQVADQALVTSGRDGRVVLHCLLIEISAARS